MTLEKRPPSPTEIKTAYWARMALSVRQGLAMHLVSEQMTKTPGTQERPWRNVTEHCLVEVARAEVLGEWLRLPKDLIMDIKLGAVLHDFSKRQEITVTRKANQNNDSPLDAVKVVQTKSDEMLITAGFNNRVRRLASASGGYAPQLVEAQRILDQSTLSNDDLAYLIVHYVDDCSIGADWVKSSQVDNHGKRINIIDYRTQGDKSKSDYRLIDQEIAVELANHPKLGGMNPHNAMAIVSRQIEERIAEHIIQRTGEDIDPLRIPELVDEKIRTAIVGG